MINIFIFFYFIIASAFQAEAIEQEKFVQVKDANLFCRIYGEGQPVIVIHGAPKLCQDYLLPHMANLPANHSVIFYDQRGCGKSLAVISEKNINVENFVDDIEAIRQSIGAERISIIGHSWGAFLGMKYAILHPDSINKLVLVGSMPASHEGFSLMVKEIAKRLSKESMDAANSDEKQQKAIFQAYMYSSQDITKLNLYLTPEAIINGSKVFELLCIDIFMKPYDIISELPQIKCSTLILHGDSDPIPYSAVEQIHEHIPQSKLVKISQCGHFPFVEQCEEFSKEINQFLNQERFIFITPIKPGKVDLLKSLTPKDNPLFSELKYYLWIQKIQNQDFLIHLFKENDQKKILELLREKISQGDSTALKLEHIYKEALDIDLVQNNFIPKSYELTETLCVPVEDPALPIKDFCIAYPILSSKKEKLLKMFQNKSEYYSQQVQDIWRSRGVLKMQFWIQELNNKLFLLMFQELSGDQTAPKKKFLESKEDDSFTTAREKEFAEITGLSYEELWPNLEEI